MTRRADAAPVPTDGLQTALAAGLVISLPGSPGGSSERAIRLRHTCVTNLVRGGTDVVLVAELAGRLFPRLTADAPSGEQ